MIAVITGEQLILGGVGLVLIALNKLLANAFRWWEEKVIKLSDPISPWVYRIGIIMVGALFLSIAFLK